MYIKCPKCRSKVSDQAKTCIFCGASLPVSEFCVQSDDVYRIAVNGYQETNCSDALGYLYDLQGKGMMHELSKLSSKIVDGLTLEQAIQVRDTLISMDVDCEIKKSELEYIDTRWSEKNLDQRVDNTLKCPRCGSPYVAIGNRGVTLTTGFLGASQTVNRCGKCGYKWKPRL